MFHLSFQSFLFYKLLKWSFKLEISRSLKCLNYLFRWLLLLFSLWVSFSQFQLGMIHTDATMFLTSSLGTRSWKYDYLYIYIYIAAYYHAQRINSNSHYASLDCLVIIYFCILNWHTYTVQQHLYCILRALENWSVLFCYFYTFSTQHINFVVNNVQRTSKNALKILVISYWIRPYLLKIYWNVLTFRVKHLI